MSGPLAHTVQSCAPGEGQAAFVTSKQGSTVADACVFCGSDGDCFSWALPSRTPEQLRVGCASRRVLLALPAASVQALFLSEPSRTLNSILKAKTGRLPQSSEACEQ